MIKLITSIRPSDNGNAFLCETCVNSRIKSGTHSQKEIICRASYERPRIVSFVVTQCDDYVPKNLEPPQAELQSMKRQAYFVDSSTEGRGITLVPPDEAKRRQLWYD